MSRSRGSRLQNRLRYVRRRLERPLWRLIEIEPLRRCLTAAIRHISGPPDGIPGPVVLCVVRDGEAFLDEFLAHYRRIGAAHFVLLDNGSEDTTVARAAAEPDVTVLSSRLPFGVFKHYFRHHLLRTYGRGRWAASVDIDEFLDYPGSDRVRLPDLTSYLDRFGYDAVVGQMLDLFPDGPLREGGLAGFRERHVYYETEDALATSYRYANELPDRRIRVFWGGVRKRLFVVENLLLTKHPLLRYEPRGPMRLPTNSHGLAGARIADLSCVLLHYKFLGDLRARADEAAVRGQYASGSYEYRRYQTVLSRSPDLVARRESSRRYRGPAPLVRSGFLTVSPRFEAWLSECSLRSAPRADNLGQ